MGNPHPCTICPAFNKVLLCAATRLEGCKITLTVK
jgi:hypothetical protein